ncbi:hypothetical protein ACQLR8_004136, partial [Escherichia coli]
TSKTPSYTKSVSWQHHLLHEQNRVVPVIEGKTWYVAPNFDL